MERKPDYAHRLTDKELAELEHRISAIYQEAWGSLDETVRAYFESFRKRDEEMKKLIGTIQSLDIKPKRPNPYGAVHRSLRTNGFIALAAVLIARIAG